MVEQQSHDLKVGSSILSSATKQQCQRGGIGIHKRLKISGFGMRVRVPPLVPNK